MIKSYWKVGFPLLKDADEQQKYDGHLEESDVRLVNYRDIC